MLKGTRYALPSGTIRCQKGHEWTARSYSLKRGNWCRHCAWEELRLDLEEAKQFAAEHGGEVLSTSMRGGADRIRWRCSEGHEFEHSLSYLKQRGFFCLECRKSERRRAANKTPEENFALLQKIVAEKGGRCLDSTFTSTKAPMEFESSHGHRWHARPANIIHRNSWCPTCARLARRKS